MTIEYTAPQGSPAWRAARAGVITASTFAMICKRVNGLNEQQAAYVAAIKGGASQAAAMAEAGYKSPPKSQTVARALAGLPVGEFSDVTKNLAFRLAIERISGEPLDEGFSTWAMDRGHELEPHARAAHEERVQDIVTEVGFVTTDDGWFGASADGFRAGRTIGAEYKAFIAPDKLRPILLDGDTSEVLHQCQGGMWLTGADKWEFGLYCPALKPLGREFTMIEIARDDDFIETMERDLIEFRALVMHYESWLRHGRPGAVEKAAEAVQASAESDSPPWLVDLPPAPPAAAAPAGPTTPPRVEEPAF